MSTSSSRAISTPGGAIAPPDAKTRINSGLCCVGSAVIGQASGRARVDRRFRGARVLGGGNERSGGRSGAGAAGGAHVRPDGLVAVAMVAAYYRIAVDPVQLQHEMALKAADATAEDVVRAARRIGLKLASSPPQSPIGFPRSRCQPSSALRRAASEFSAGPQKGVFRLIDVLKQAPRDTSREEIAAWDGEIVLVTRRFGGAGIDPKTFGFRWFLPSILRYRKPLAHVVVASLFVQIFALVTPLFFQLVVDKVLVHKGYLDAGGALIGMVSLGAVRDHPAISAHLHAEPHHEPHRRRARPAAVPSPVPAAARLFRDPRRRPDGGARARAGDDPQLPHRSGPHLGARSVLHARLLRRDVRLFAEADAGRARLDPGLCAHRRADPAGPARAHQREIQSRRA